MQSELENKVVLITGASGGIGGACARVFAEEGARVVLHGHTNMAAVERLDADLDCETMAVQADLTQEGDVDAMFRKAAARFGGVDVLVANAGRWPPEQTPIHEMSLERWNQTIATNQTSVFLCARAFFRQLAERKPDHANMVIIGSTAAVFGEAGHGEYAASKAAITYGLTRTLKNEIVALVPNGRVNAVCPGWTVTPMARTALTDPESVVPILQTRPLRQIGRPEDIANTVVYLASDRLARHLTGQVITVAGGMEGRLLHDPADINLDNL